MKIYNSLSRQKEEFVPIKKGKIGMYVCGPTVYDEPHIGHARSAYIFDYIRRYFEYRDYKVKFVRNVTDVDDKIIEKARSAISHRQSAISLKDMVSEISEKYLKAYHDDMELLGLGAPDEEPKATEYIPKMVKFIELLIKKTCAYEADGDVYFNIKKANNYGKLSNQNLEKMEVGAKIASGEKKIDPLDFALWKKAKEGEPSWQSPWGMGRPGWHIECSVMSSCLLGDEFDIHGGGIDLIFPHHENEVVQSEGAEKRFARYWIHNGLLTINGEKMAKSLGNFITIKDFIDKHKDPDYLKLLFLNTHYRHPVDYTDVKIGEMKSQKENINIFIDSADRLLDRFKSIYGQFPSIDYADDDSQISDIKIWRDRFYSAMDNDFNTSLALAELFNAIHHVNIIMSNMTYEYKEKDSDIYIKIEYVLRMVKGLLINIFGLNFKKDEISNAEKRSIEDRNEARIKKDYRKADEIRDILLRQNLILEDTKNGTTWRRKI